jgi:hypothetical protein
MRALVQRALDWIQALNLGRPVRTRLAYAAIAFIGALVPIAAVTDWPDEIPFFLLLIIGLGVPLCLYVLVIRTQIMSTVTGCVLGILGLVGPLPGYPQFFNGVAGRWGYVLLLMPALMFVLWLIGWIADLVVRTDQRLGDKGTPPRPPGTGLVLRPPALPVRPGVVRGVATVVPRPPEGLLALSRDAPAALPSSHMAALPSVADLPRARSVDLPRAGSADLPRAGSVNSRPDTRAAGGVGRSAGDGGLGLGPAEAPGSPGSGPAGSGPSGSMPSRPGASGSGPGSSGEGPGLVPPRRGPGIRIEYRTAAEPAEDPAVIEGDVLHSADHPLE